MEETKKKYYSPASAKASVKYQKAHYERITLSVPKATKELWKSEAEKRSLSLSAFIKNSVEYQIKNEGE